MELPYAIGKWELLGRSNQAWPNWRILRLREGHTIRRKKARKRQKGSGKGNKHVIKEHLKGQGSRLGSLVQTIAFLCLERNPIGEKPELGSFKHHHNWKMVWIENIKKSMENSKTSFQSRGSSTSHPSNPLSKVFPRSHAGCFEAYVLDLHLAQIRWRVRSK